MSRRKKHKPNIAKLATSLLENHHATLYSTITAPATTPTSALTAPQNPTGARTPSAAFAVCVADALAEDALELVTATAPKGAGEPDRTG